MNFVTATQRLRAAVTNEIPSSFNAVHYTAFRSVLLGAGFCYAISEEKYHHLPVAFLIPSAYAGYQMYKHKDAAAEWMKAKLLN